MSGPIPRFADRKILVVDDEPANRRLIRAILAPCEATIIQAGDGPTAIELAAAGDIDLVLLDVVMPFMDGIDVCRTIRERSTSYVPIVLITALADRDSRARGKAAGADDFLTKPVHEDELLARVTSLLQLREYQQLVIAQRTAAEQSAERYQLIAEVAAAVASSRDFASLLDQVTRALAPAIPIDCAVVLDVQGHDLVAREWCAITRASGAARAMSVPWELGPWSDRLREHHAVVVSRTAPIPPFDMMLAARGFEEAVVLPVLAADELQGVFVVARRRAFEPDEVETLTELAPHVGNAINTVRLLLDTQRLLRAREELAQLIVHDLRTPLAVVSSNLELARAIGVSGDAAECVDDALLATRRILGLLTEILDTSAAEDGRLRVAPEPTDLAALARKVAAETLDHHAQAKYRVALAIGADADGLMTMLDPGLVRRVLENLLGNASRYAAKVDGAPATVGIDLVRGPTGFTLAVHNTGPVIPPELRANLFSKYGGGRGVNGKVSGRTRGLGLYFCRLAIEAHNGTIEETGAASGARFEIRLPYVPPPVEAVAPSGDVALAE